MQTSFESHENPLIRKLNSIFTLTDDERRALEGLPMQVAVLKENQDIVREGDSPSRCCLLLSGFACTYKVTGEGRRQIMAFNIAGDVPDLQSLHLKVLDNSVGTITPCRVGFIPHEALHDICARHPPIAHLLCEMLVRLKAVSLAEDHSCDLPITQAEYGDALGLSTVHVNRVFQALRADGLIETRGTQVNIPDWERLRQAGEFDPAYLHLEQAAA